MTRPRAKILLKGDEKRPYKSAHTSYTTTTPARKDTQTMTCQLRAQ